MGLRIGILYNDTHESLAAALRTLLPASEIVSFDLNAPGLDIAATDAALRGCDRVISADAPPRFGPLATRALVGVVPRLHLLPPLRFGGFHPDMLSVALDDAPVAGPTGTYHSRIVIAAYLAGVAAEDAALLFNRLVFSRLGYFGALERQSAAAGRRYAAYGIDLATLLPRWTEGGCFMHTPDHPKMRVMMELAWLACVRMEVQAGVPEGAPADPLGGQPGQPFFPDLASRAGLEAEGAFRGPDDTLTAPEFVAASYRALQRVPLSRLRMADGVAEAMAALEMRPVSLAPGKSLPGQFGLLSWHGTVVRLERASGLLVQEPPWPDTPECVDFTLTPQPGTSGAATAEVLPGLEIVSGALDGTQALRRAGKFLSSDPARLAVPFRADAAGDWEGFLLLSLEQLALLRRILSRRWSCEAPPCRLHPARFRFASGYRLDVGPFVVDLRLHWPAEQADGSVTLHTDQGVRVLRPIEAQAMDGGIPLLPVASTAPEAASLAEFRSAGALSWRLDTEAEILHPPLTVRDADAAWLFGAASGPPPFGMRRPSVALRRGAGSALLAAGFGGCLLDGRGMLHSGSDRGTATLPAGLREDCGVMLADPALLTQGQEVDGPVMVVGWPAETAAGANDGAWLLEAALKLHIMAPFCPPGTPVLVPEDHAAAWAGLAGEWGLGAVPVVSVAGDVCQVRDAIWLDHDGLAGLPAASLHRFRAQTAALHASPGAGRRIILQRAGTPSLELHPKLEKILLNQGFAPVEFGRLPQGEIIRTFLEADTVIAASGPELAYLVFCPEGTLVLEMAPESGFSTLGWLMAEKMGLIHGVLPCPTVLGAQQAETKRVRALMRVVRSAGRAADAESE